MGIIRRDREFEEGPGWGEGPSVMTNEEKYSDFDNTTGLEKNQDRTTPSEGKKKNIKPGKYQRKIQDIYDGYTLY